MSIKSFRQQKPLQKGGIMKDWLKFLAGTPKRAMLSLLATFMVINLFFPPLADYFVERLASALWPLVSIGVTLAILWFAYYMVAGIKCGKWN